MTVKEFKEFLALKNVPDHALIVLKDYEYPDTVVPLESVTETKGRVDDSNPVIIPMVIFSLD